MTTPDWLHGLIDDAAIFPPGNAPLDRAVAEHLEHRASDYANLLGGFVVSDLKVADLIDVLDGSFGTVAAQPPQEPTAQTVAAQPPQEPTAKTVAAQPPQEPTAEAALPVNVVVTGGAGAIEPAVRWLNRAPTVTLRAVEFALRDEEDLAHNARRAITAWDLLEDDNPGTEVYIELPKLDGAPTYGWLAAMDEIAARGLRAKFRTGGVEQYAFPTCGELGDAISAALDRELPFKCTAGLHHALRHHDPVTDLTHHGFLNVLRATRAALDGDDPSEVLAEESASVLLDGFDADEAARTRDWFTSFGSCSVLEPHEDLVELGLL